METGQFLLYTVAIIILLLGIAGNLFVVIAVWKKRSLRSTTNYLLVNLAVSDTISLTFLPLQLVQMLVPLREGPLADFLCKFFISFHVPFTASDTSILTLSVLAVERYHAIVKPMRTGIRLREDTVRYAIMAVWMSALVLTLPMYIFGYYKENFKACKFDDNVRFSLFRIIYFILVSILVIVIPVLTITFCYIQIVRELYFKTDKVTPQNVATEQDIKDKRKLIKIAFLVTLANFVCFFPLIVTYAMSRMAGMSDRYFKVATILYFFGPVVNPLLYGFQSSNFRQAFKDILKCNIV